MQRSTELDRMGSALAQVVAERDEARAKLEEYLSSPMVSRALTAEAELERAETERDELLTAKRDLEAAIDAERALRMHEEGKHRAEVERLRNGFAAVVRESAERIVGLEAERDKARADVVREVLEALREQPSQATWLASRVIEERFGGGSQ